MLPTDAAEWRVLDRAYAAFNARDIDAVLATMHPHVVWPNGMEGGYLHGQAAVRGYWTRQWTQIDPCVQPVACATDSDGRIVLQVHQIVRALAGAVIVDQMLEHVYEMRDGLIARMEIRSVCGSSNATMHSTR